jgi:hypothetical protein
MSWNPVAYTASVNEFLPSFPYDCFIDGQFLMFPSVQDLADQANALGAWIDAVETPQWIGIPLRVHRRCVDPMFRIANEIAYQGKMIFFDLDNPALQLPPPDSLDLGPSAWVNVGGNARDKHVVPKQIDLVCQAAEELYRRTDQLPDLYIISPFKRIKNALIRRLSKADAWPTDNRPSTKPLLKWCKDRIGTVHTFHGKEESLVWMVPGCDANTRARRCGPPPSPIYLMSHSPEPSIASS